MVQLVMRVVAASEDSILAPGTLIFVESDDVVMGRGEQADVLVPDPTVSRRHARLRLLDGGLRIERIAQGNALYVDEADVADKRDVDGDEALLQLGAVVLALQRTAGAASRTTERVEGPATPPTPRLGPGGRWRVVWDAQNCTVFLDERELELPPLAASFLGQLLETPDQPVHQWDLLDRLGPKTNLNQCASLVRRALRRRVEQGALAPAELAASVDAVLDVPLEEADLGDVLKKLIGNQRGYGYVARVGKMGVGEERL